MPLDPNQVPELRQRIADHILFWRQFADALKEAAKKPGGRDAKPTQADVVLDLKRASAHVRRQTDRVEAYLTRIEHDFAKGLAPNLAAVLLLLEEALLLTTRVHQCTIVDNEPAIAHAAARPGVLAKNREKASAEAEQEHQSLKARADEIREAHPSWNDSRVAKQMIKDDPTLTQKREFHTIRRLIKMPGKQNRRSSK
jgi:hypothetical protein